MADDMNHRWRILIVDDDLRVLESLRRTFKYSDLDLTCLDDPVSAIDLLSRESFDLLLSDVNMPELCGHELMQKALSLRPKMVRVFLTGGAQMDAAVRAINEGEVHRFVRKPYNAEDLRDLIEQALERKAELDLVSEANSRSLCRRRLFAHLELEHPGITAVEFDEVGVYTVQAALIEEVADSVGLMGLLTPKS